MSFRRSEFDVTNRINTTDPESVKQEVARIYRNLYARPRAQSLMQAFDDVVRMYRGEYEGLVACDTAYHNLQHILEVTLAMARLVDGYERSRVEAPAIDEKLFQLGVICALFHDSGYLRKKGDKRYTNGAAYTTRHVSRGAKFLRSYLPTIGMAEFTDVAGCIIHFTGYERPVATIRVPHPIYRLVGSLLGSADIIAQMSDRCYLEKCRDRLWPEFVEGGIARRKTADGEIVVFASAEDLLRKTPAFFATARKRLDSDLGGAYDFAKGHFGGANPYLDAVKQNIRFIEHSASSGEITLRRQPPPVSQ